jgi:hypothetical protein
MLQQQHMRSISAAKQQYVSCSLALGSLLRRNRVAAATQRAAAASLAADEQQQQHTPHVSVLLQEVLTNLNHMPIQVWGHTSYAAVRPVRRFSQSSRRICH